jgi:hypothetical protein
MTAQRGHFRKAKKEKAFREYLQGMVSKVNEKTVNQREQDLDILEKMIDENSVTYVLELISDLCGIKAERARQDACLDPTVTRDWAKAWGKARDAAHNVARKIQV